MTNATSPQRAASAEERLVSTVAEALETFQQRDGYQKAVIVEILEDFGAILAAPLLDRITAAEARAEEAERARKLPENPNRRTLIQAQSRRHYQRVCDLLKMIRDLENMRASEADAATADCDRLADEVARLRGALKPFAGLRFSFDGFSCDPATLVFQHREYGQWRSDDHAAFEALIDAARRALTATGGPTDDQA